MSLLSEDMHEVHATLRREGCGCTVAEMARWLAIPPHRVRRALQQLEREGNVVKHDTYWGLR